MIDPKNKAFSLVDEFKKFALKGNVIDMAVGVIIGAAFGKVIDSLVKNVFMPLINLLPFKADNFDEVVIPVYDGKVIPIGKFITDVVAFLIVALALFIFMVKVLGFIMRNKKEEAPPAPPPPTKDQELLAEIRDLLKQRQG